MNERWVVLSSPALGDGRWEVLELRGREALNRLFRYEVRARCPDGSARELAEKLLEQPVSLTFEEGGAGLRHVHGIASEVSYSVDAEGQAATVSLTVVPRAWLLTERVGAQIYLGMSVPEVLAAKLQAIGLKAGEDYAIAVDGRYEAREIIVQYEESDWEFFSRLCEHDGLISLFDHSDGKDVLRLADTQGVFSPISRSSIPVRARRDHPAAFDVSSTLRRRIAEALVHDYNYRTPGVGLEEAETVPRLAAGGMQVEYGAHTKSSDETRRLAAVRAEEIGCGHHQVRGKSSELSMRAGGTFVLVDGAGNEDELLITELQCRSHEGDGGAKPWEMAFVAQPQEVPFRPARVTERPRVSGLVHATVDGAIKGHYAELDEMGRYHVRVGFDRSGRTDLGASHPVRMMQPHAGARYGMHFPLRPGTEVLLGFVDGNPDRPVIVGTAPNPQIWSPVDQSNYTQNVLRTGSNNELVIEDEIGNERIRLHTPHSNTTVQLGSIEEPEVGALTTTQANISAASRGPNTVAADRQAVMVRQAATLTGGSALVLTGLDGMVKAAERGLDQLDALDHAEIAKNLTRLAMSPEDAAEADEQQDDEQDEQGATESANGGGNEMGDGAAGGALWSATGTSLSEAAHDAAMAAMRTMAECADSMRDESLGRRQGEPMGQPLAPAAVLGSPWTSAMFGRDRAFVFGDHAAILASYDSAALLAKRVAEVKSQETVEVAGTTEICITTAGLLDVAADRMRFVAGYYPERSAPPLHEGTSIGMMARDDLHLLSIEHCILACAKKNFIASAHEGDMRLSAEQVMSLKGGSVTVSGGSIHLGSGGKTAVEAGGDVEIEGANVTIKGGTITLDGDVEVTGNMDIAGDLLVCGSSSV